MSKKVKTTTVTYSQVQEAAEDYKHPSKHYIIDAMGDYVYFHCRERSDAQKAVDEEYGKGKYSIRLASTEKGGGNVSCKGFTNSKSLSGQRLVSIRNSQGRGCD